MPNKKKTMNELANLDEIVKQTGEREQKLADSDPIHLDQKDLYHSNAKATKHPKHDNEKGKEHAHHEAPVKLTKKIHHDKHDKHDTNEKHRSSETPSAHTKSKKGPNDSDPKHSAHPEPTTANTQHHHNSQTPAPVGPTVHPAHDKAPGGHPPTIQGSHPVGAPGHPVGGPGHPVGGPGHAAGAVGGHPWDINANTVPLGKPPLPNEEDEEFMKITPQSQSNMPFSSSTEVDNKGLPQLLQTHPDDLIKTVYPPHIILLRQYGLLFLLYITSALSGVGCIIWIYHQHILGAPPTVFSEEAYFNSMCALLTLFVSSVISIIILRAKVHHLAFGYLVMFLFVVTLYFTMGGISRSYLSLKFDDVVTIEKYIFRNDTRTEGQLPTFFQRIQAKFKCCGTSHVDKMDDWPARLGTVDMPESCCRLPTYNCGSKLGRTYSYSGSNRGPMRVPSGFFVTLAEAEMNEIIKVGKPMKIIRPGKDSVNTVLQILGKYYFKVLKESYVPGTDVNDMRRIENSIIHPINITEDSKPLSLACQDDAALEKTTMIGWEIQRMIDKETSRMHQKTDPIAYHWMAWKIPVCNEIAGRAPYHLAANLKRDMGTTLNTEIKHMWYVSRGVTENFILKDKLWDLYCETENNFRLIRLKPYHHQRTFTDERYQVIGTFFLAFVQQLMILCIGVSGFVGVCLIIVFLIFWKYYTKMRLEEFANLPYPSEFDGLEVRQSDLYIKHNKAEYVQGAHKIVRHSDDVAPKPKNNKIMPMPIHNDEDKVSPQISQHFSSNLVSSKPSRGSEFYPSISHRPSEFVVPGTLPDAAKGIPKGPTENLAKSTPPNAQQGLVPGLDMKNKPTVPNSSTPGQGPIGHMPPKPAAATPSPAPNADPTVLKKKSEAPPAPPKPPVPGGPVPPKSRPASNQPYQFTQDDLDMFEAAEAGNFDPSTVADTDDTD